MLTFAIHNAFREGCTTYQDCYDYVKNSCGTSYKDFDKAWEDFKRLMIQDIILGGHIVEDKKTQSVIFFQDTGRIEVSRRDDIFIYHKNDYETAYEQFVNLCKK